MQLFYFTDKLRNFWYKSITHHLYHFRRTSTTPLAQESDIEVRTMNENNTKLEGIKIAIFERLQKDTSFDQLTIKNEYSKSTFYQYYIIGTLNDLDSQSQWSRMSNTFSSEGKEENTV